MKATLARRLAAEGIGTAILLATIIGSTLMGEQLAGGYTPTAHLAAALATGGILIVLILMFGPVSGAHFNPAVTLSFLLRKEISPKKSMLYILVQVLGGFLGVMMANVMFGVDAIDPATMMRNGTPLWLSESIATFGLVGAIIAVKTVNEKAVAYAVGLYIMAAYWFTSSTTFANPAVTLARTISDSAAGILPSSVPAFLAFQIVGAVLATFVIGWIVAGKK